MMLNDEMRNCLDECDLIESYFGFEDRNDDIMCVEKGIIHQKRVTIVKFKR